MEFGEFRVPDAYEHKVAIERNGKWVEEDMYKAIVGENGEVYAIVSKYYRLVLHRDVIDATNEALKEMGIEPIDYWADVSWDGAVMFYKVLIRELEIDGNKLRFGLMVTNSYNLKLGINVLGFGMNMFCMNQMMFGREILKVKKRHREGSVGVELENLKDAIVEVIDGLENIKDIIVAAREKKVSALEIVRFIRDLKLSKRNVIKVCKLIEKYAQFNVGAELIYGVLKEEVPEAVKKTEVTLWDLYSAVTDFLTHHFKSKDLSKVLELQNKAAKLLVKEVR